jgi:FAD/FMN-containing dehydrogenase
MINSSSSHYTIFYHFNLYRKTSLHYGSYYKGPVCTPNEAIRHPKTKAEVVSIVREAILRRKTCKAFGSLHSATDIICTDGIPIDMSEIGVLRMNSDSTVTVGAGVSLRTLGDFLMHNGRGLRTTPGFGNITIGGAVGTGNIGNYCGVKHFSFFHTYN